MAEPADLATIRRHAFLRALHRTAKHTSATVVPVLSLVQALSLPIGLLRFVIDPLVSEGVITIEGGLDSGTVLLTEKGILEVNGVVNRHQPSRTKTKILCVDTEPETGQRLKDAGYAVFEVSMGYRTGKRNFSFPPPNEMNLIVCDLKRPACFDAKDWGPSGSNDNYRCRIIRHEEAVNTFSAINNRRLARYRVIYETQLGKPIPGAFGPKEVNRAIVEGGVPFLLFLNEEWLAHIQEFPNWFDVKWSFLPTAATEVEIAEPLPTLLPEVGREIKLKLALQHRIEKGPLFGQRSPRFPTVAKAIVSNNIGDVFGQFVIMGKGGVWLLPATHHNADVLELISSRLGTMRQVAHSSNKPAYGNVHQRQVQLDEITPHPVSTLQGAPVITKQHSESTTDDSKSLLPTAPESTIKPASGDLQESADTLHSDPSKRPGLSVEGGWEHIEIVFLSDERVQIRIGKSIETRNYAEFGFQDGRNQNPNRAWETLRRLAELRGVIRDGTEGRLPWPKVEKRVQEIRKVLRKHFSISTDPVPFVEGTGYHARFKIGCGISYHT
jgi:hypothetical protein